VQGRVPALVVPLVEEMRGISKSGLCILVAEEVAVSVREIFNYKKK